MEMEVREIVAQLRDGDVSVTLIREEDLAEIAGELGPEHAKPSKWASRSLVPWTWPRDTSPIPPNTALSSVG